MTINLNKAFAWSFYLFLFLLPINLGKHLIFDFSYLDGILVDYWVPTIFLQDLLIGVFLLLGLLLKRFKLGWFFYVVLVLLVLNLTFSVLPIVSLIYITRFVWYLLFCILIFRSKAFFDVTTVIKILYISVLLVCMLAIGQWFRQGAVFNNYLFFGEQPYTVMTSGVLKQNVFENIVVSPYSTFRHPNALAGFLSAFLVLFAYYLKGPKKNLILFIGSIVLFLTFSYAAWVSYIFGLLFISVKSVFIRKLFYIFVFIVFTCGIFGFFNAEALKHNSSLNRRFLLTTSAAYTFKQNPIVGTGLNTNMFTGKDLSYMSRELTFFQPVHNIFWLFLSEGGLLLFVPFVCFYFYVLVSAKNTSKALSAVLLQFVILGSFDHYLLTMHQTLLLFMLTIAFSIHYTFKHEI